MSSKSKKRMQLTNNRKRKQMDYSSDESIDDDEPKRKKSKSNNKRNSNNKKNMSINVSGCKSISYEKRVKQILKKTSVLLQNVKKKKFIEVGLALDGKAYSMIKGDLGTNGMKQTRNFKTKARAFNSAVKLLINKMRNGFTIIEDVIEDEIVVENDASSSSSSSEDMDMDITHSEKDKKVTTLMDKNEVKTLNHYFQATMDFSVIKHTNQKVKDMVYGFIRQYAECIVPMVINNACLLYIWWKEQFVESDTIKVLHSSSVMFGQYDVAIDANQSISHSTGGFVIDFNKNSNDLIEWIFIVKAGECGIGLRAESKGVAISYGWHNTGYLFLSSKNDLNVTSKINQKFEIGDTIKMVLDVEAKSLKFFKNNKDVNVVLNGIDETCQYKMGILMNGTGLIQIIDFKIDREE